MNKKKTLALMLTAGLVLGGCQTGSEEPVSPAAESSKVVAGESASAKESTAEEESTEEISAAENEGSHAAASAEFSRLAADYTDLLVKGQFAELAAHYNAQMAASLDAAATETAWKQVTGEVGSFVAVKSIEPADESGRNFSVTLTYENSYVLVLLGMDADGAINSLWLNLQALEAELRDTADYAETAISVGEYALKGVLAMPKNAERPPLSL